mgnify:CR=1 FL=1
MLKKFILSHLLLLIFALSVTAQNTSALREIIRSELSFEDKQIALNTFFDTLPDSTDDAKLAEYYHDYGYRWFYRVYRKVAPGGLDSAIIYFQKAANIRRTLSPPDYASLKKSLYNLNVCYQKKGETDKRLQLFTEIANIPEVDSRTLGALRELGKFYLSRGDYYRSLESLDKLIDLASGVKGREEKLVQGYYRRADTYCQMDPERFSQQIIDDLNMADSVGAIPDWEGDRFVLEIVTIRGNAANELGAYKEAISHYQRATGLVGSSNFNSENLASLYSNIGLAQVKVGQYDKAKASLNKSLQFNPLSCSNYNNLAAYFRAIGDYKNARQTLAMATSVAIGNDPDTTTLLSQELLSSAIEPYDLLQTLTDAGNTYLSSYSVEQNPQFLQRAIENYQLADRLIDIIRFNTYEVKSKLYWRKRSAALYLNAVKTCYLLDEPELAYYFMEKNKAILLLEDISENAAIDRAGIPDAIVTRETAFKKDILATETYLGDTDQTAARDSLENQLHLLKLNHQQFLDSIGEAYPVFRQFKKRLSVMPVASFREKLLADQTNVIHYILDDQQGYGLYSTAGTMTLFEIKDLNILRDEVSQLRDASGNILTTQTAFDAYQALANSIGQKILPKAIKESTGSGQSLLIIPDYYLQLMSFETLMRDQRYLIEDFEVRYAYSVSHMTENAQRDRNAPKQFIGFAPETFPNRNLVPLPDSKRELIDLQEITSGQQLVGANATKNHFFDLTDQYSVIHLSTHADAGSEDQPWIALADGNIYLPELYTTANQAEMVVLSACNTSLGALEKGEGIMSLARGFTNAGANSVVSSLWPTNDQANKELMLDFYKELSKGNNKSSALRTAKLNYLKSHSGTEASPFYWGSLALVGNNGAVEVLKSGWTPMWYIPLLLLLLIPIIMVARKKSAVGS